MCLFSKTKYPLIAEEDIVCYKTLDTDFINGKKVFITPFQHRPIHSRILSGELPFKAGGKKQRLSVNRYGNFDDKGTVIESGYIHCWANEFISFGMNLDGALYKCIIPKGTKYYRGWFNGWYNYDSVCAEQIKFVERIK